MVSDPYEGLVCKYVRLYRRYATNVNNYDNIDQLADDHPLIKLRDRIYKTAGLLEHRGYDWNRNELNLQII